MGRLQAMATAFFSYVERGVFPAVSIFANMLAEVDARPGAIRDEVREDFRGWRLLIAEWIGEAQTGDLAPDIDAAQLAFEIDAILDYANYMYMLLGDTGQLTRGRIAIQRMLDRSTWGWAMGVG